MERYGKFLMKTEPWEHQLKALCYLYKRDKAALYTKPGSGKTKIMIDLIVNRGFKRVLVVAPKKACDVWVKQIQIHSDMGFESIIPLHKLSWKGKRNEIQLAMAQPKSKTLVFICNYDSVWRKPLDKSLYYKKLGIDCVMCDESHRIKSPGSRCSRFLAKLGKRVPHRYLLTGTPLTENPMDVYAQYKFLDPEIFGTNYTEFRQTYENVDVYRSAKIGHTVLDQKTPYKNLDLLREKMFSCAFYMKPTIKLPKRKRVVVEIPMDRKAEDIYEALCEEGAIEFEEGFMTADNVLSAIVRKQQVTSGYLPLEYDDESEELVRISTFRRTALLKFVQGLPKDEPIVIFAKFRKDLYSIRKVAERLGCGYSEVSGSEDTLSDWQNGKTRIVGVQYTSGSESIDLTRAYITIFYTLDHSLGKYNQAVKRTHRPGQTRPCIFYHFVATSSKRKTIDEQIFYAWKKKKDIIDVVMNPD